ncbi:MAG: hypothetical protein QG657_5448 [Acidobacteriota bacterium]|nr:hypothetical protein [Acidobacteriota bacterium]
MKKIITILLLAVSLTVGTYQNWAAEEIPRPTYDNSMMFSITHNFLDEEQAEIDSIKNQFGNGLYAPLLFSDFIGVDMEWHIDINNIGDGIKDFKTELDRAIAFAKQNKVGIHLSLTYGLARFVEFYKEAKEEDIRNAQWYNDNNISSSAQGSESFDAFNGGIGSPQESGGTGFPIDLNHIDRDDESLAQSKADASVINKYVWATLSRYARKLRAHLNAKITAAMAYIKQVQAANPSVYIVISAPGEVELNYNRSNQSQFLQDYFCDYSPFAVLEFQDWIRHTGLYADGQEYAGEGYSSGGSRYQGSSGLANLNSDFGTSFTTWSLKYFNWSLADAVDSNYTDSVNPDPNIIPVSQYTYGGMKPTSGAYYISGGFDPPRAMSDPGDSAFYDLWNTFRETMVYHYVKDMANIARNSGFPKSHYFTHQIPADYLFGTRPNDPLIPYLNPRYYSSASPLWTADVYPDIGLGITLYDINFGTWFARTTLYGIDAADALSDNWAALEYNPEVIPTGYTATLSSAQFLYNQMMRLYDGSPHVVSFFKWEGQSDYQFKGTNRGTAAKKFFDAIRDKARQSITTVFSPKAVESFKANFNSITGLVQLFWSEKIWTNLKYNWTDWGDFKEFVIYRGYTSDFTANTASEIKRTTGASYIDYEFTHGKKVYYKIAAVNSKGVLGPIKTVSVQVPGGTFNPILGVDKTQMHFGYLKQTENPPVQYFLVLNKGTGVLDWTISDDAPWLVCSPTNGLLGAPVEVYANVDSLSPGPYSATITISSSVADDSPQTVSVSLIVKRIYDDKPPFGEFATPVDGSLVSSSIPVTGWALDDIYVDSVKIYRDPVEGEGLQMVYIGDALFVEGARPDIEIAYNDYPFNYKAGWGYMLLTNFLPNGGNGTFILYAIAKDSEGTQVTLGSSTITCDNANAVKPFGAIDNPGPGGSASGTAFRNQGWALTPMPNSISNDGSTINVYIDGVAKGHVVYNLSRADIAALFPGYANSSGAGGYFDFDTTRYTDGIHTIAWVATDSAGNGDGIGSRYFAVQNSGGTSDLRLMSPENETLNIPLDKSAPGIFQEEPMLLETRELERVEINLGFKCRGYLEVGDRVKSLPVGSTLDSEKGIFYWQPGPGFVGDYQLQFVGFDSVTGEIVRKQVNIRILPKFPASAGREINMER